MEAVDERYDGRRDGEPDDAVEDVSPDDRQPPSDEEAEQDNYANTDDEES